jgi:hypothetical protein
MTRRTLAVIAATLASAAPATRAAAQVLHVSTRWKQCAIQLDPSLTQSAWYQFTKEAGEALYFRALSDASPMGKWRFKFTVMQTQTNVDSKTSAWNDTFVHPYATHWLYEGGGLTIPGLSFRMGVGAQTDVGLYFTQNMQANYGSYGVQLQQNVVGGGTGDWNLAVRGSWVSLFGPHDVGLNIYGAEAVTSWKGWKFGKASLAPYASVTTYLSSSHAESPVVNLADVNAVGVMGTLGAAFQWSVVRVAGEASMGSVPSFAIVLGLGR